MNGDVARQRGLKWTARRVYRGGGREAAWRIGHLVALARWERQPFSAAPLRLPDLGVRTLSTTIPVQLHARVDQLLAGRVSLLSCTRPLSTAKDWIGDGGAASQMGHDRDGTEAQESVKHTWELARLGPVVDLAAAWRLLGDERYAVRAAQLLEDWCEVLADRRSVLWGSGVEAALRLFALGWVCALFGDRMTSGFPLVPLGGVAHRHLDRLRRFPSRYSSANNHALVEAAGLLAGSAVFGPVDSREADRALGNRRLRAQLTRQLSPGGLHCEAATDYHAFVSDVLVATLLMHDLAGSERPPFVTDSLRDMLGASLTIHAAGGPRFGDGDDSQCFGFDDRPPLDRAIELGQVALGVGTPATWQGAFAADLSSIGRTASPSGPADAALAPTDRAALASDGWMTVLRSTNSSVAMRTGALGYLSVAAHAHADLLSVIVSAHREPLIVDPGTFCYDSHPAWRRWFRSSAAHNCLVVDGLDQAEYWGPFLWGTDAYAQVCGFSETDEGGSAVAQLAAQGPLPAVRRRLELSANRLDIIDTVIMPAVRERSWIWSGRDGPIGSDGPHRGCLRWQLHPAVDVVETDAALQLIGPSGSVEMTVPSGWIVQCERGIDPPIATDVGGWVSTSFGTRTRSVAVVARGVATPETELVTSFCW